MAYSLVELIIPIAVHGSGVAFVVFIPEGPFFENDYGGIALSFRASFVAMSYGILVIHFIYRYLLLYKPYTIDTVLSPIGMLFIFIFFVFHAVFWFTVCEIFLSGNAEVRDYIYDDIMDTYQVDSHKLSMLVAMYFDASFSVIWKSWAGIVLLTCLSIYAISTYFILGFKIVRKLKENQGISTRTAKLHKQLFTALVVQTGIPICISFAPCMCAWITPAIGINLGMWNNYFCVVVFSAFPTLDPLAIMLLLPNYKKRLLKCFDVCCRNVEKTATVSVTAQNLLISP